MELKKKRWLILAASCLINLCIGALYAWSVFAAPAAAHLSGISGTEITAGDLALAFTLANAVGPVTMITGGWFNDRIGPKWIIFIGGLLFGAGFIAAGLARTPSALTLGYSLGCGLGMGLVYGCTVSNAVKFFPDKRGLTGGIATAAYGLSSVLIPPVANRMIQADGVTYTFQLLGVVFLVIICAASQLIEKCPEGFMAAEISSRKGLGNAASADRNWREMLRDPTFYVMLMLLCCGAFSGLMITSQAAPIAQNMIGMTPAAAAAAVSVLALFNAAGRVSAGLLSDKLGRVQTLFLMCLLSAGGLALLYLAGPGQTVWFMIGVSIMGLCFGAFMGIFPGFTADQFGASGNSVNYGIMFIGFALAGIFGPMIVNRAYGASGSYKPAFLIAAALAAAGALLTFGYRRLRKAVQQYG